MKASSLTSLEDGRAGTCSSHYEFVSHQIEFCGIRVKPEKDLRQAATLIEALAEGFPNAMEEAVGALPKSAVRYAVRALKPLERHLPSSEQSAWEELRSLRGPK